LPLSTLPQIVLLASSHGHTVITVVSKIVVDERIIRVVMEELRLEGVRVAAPT
jgi:hypothetical protein